MRCARGEVSAITFMGSTSILKLPHDATSSLVWAFGFVDNMARRPQGNDRAQAKAIFAGECDVALMNTYYFGKMKFSEDQPEQKEWADAIELAFFNQDGRGQHVNISAAGITKGSQKKDMARAFLEWLTSEEAQQIYTEINFEYPVNPNAKTSDEVASWGSFKMDALPMNVIADTSPLAQRIIHETGKQNPWQRRPVRQAVFWQGNKANRNYAKYQTHNSNHRKPLPFKRDRKAIGHQRYQRNSDR